MLHQLFIRKTIDSFLSTRFSRLGFFNLSFSSGSSTSSVLSVQLADFSSDLLVDVEKFVSRLLVRLETLDLD